MKDLVVLLSSIATIALAVTNIINFFRNFNKKKFFILLMSITPFVFIQQLILYISNSYMFLLRLMLVIIIIILACHSFWIFKTKKNYGDDYLTERMVGVPFLGIGMVLSLIIISLIQQNKNMILIFEQTEYTKLEFLQKLSSYKITIEMFHFLISNLLITVAFIIMILHILSCAFFVFKYLETWIKRNNTHFEYGKPEFDKEFLTKALIAMLCNPPLIYPCLVKIFSLS